MAAWRTGLLTLALSAAVAFAVPPNADPPAESPAVPLGSHVKQALDELRPGSVIVPADRYHALVEKAERLDKQEGKPGWAFGECVFAGQVVRDAATGREIARLRVVLSFRTDTAGAVIPLGFRGAKLTHAALDGKPPIWGTDPEGLTLLVKEPDWHELVLEMNVAVVRADAERRLVLERVPPAATTRLRNFQVPERVHTAFVRGPKGSVEVGVQTTDGPASVLSAEALGVLESLELVWQVGAGSVRSGPTLTVTGDLRITIGETATVTDAQLRIEPKQGQVGVLRFRVPPDANVFYTAQLEPGGQAVPLEHSFDRKAQALGVHLKQPLSAGDPPLVLRIQMQQNHPGRPGTAIPLGLLELLERRDSAQSGIIQITADVRVSFQHQNLTPVKPVDRGLFEGRGAAYAFRYWQQPVKLTAQLEPTPAVAPVVEVRATHTLRVVAGSLLLMSEFEVTRIARQGIETLELNWPQDFLLDRRALLQNLNLVQTVDDPVDGVLRLRLVGPQQSPFTLKVEGWLPIQAPDRVAVELPALRHAAGDRHGKPEPAQVVFQAGEVKVLPGAEFDVTLERGTSGVLAANGRPPELGTVLPAQASFSLQPPAPPRPWQLVLAWQPRRPEAVSRAEVFLSTEELRLRQTVALQFPGPPPAQLGLHWPRELDDACDLILRYQTREGKRMEVPARLAEPTRTIDQRLVERACPLPGDLHGGCELVLSYRKRLSAEWRKRLMGGSAGVPLAVPLAAPDPEEVRTTRTDVRLLACTQIRLAGPGGPTRWQTVALPAGTNDEMLPSLELRSTGAESLVELICLHVPDSPLPDLTADRVLVEVRSVSEGKALEYRARFRLAQIRTNQIDVRLPAPPRALIISSVRVNEVQRAAEQLLVPLDGPEAATQTLLRIPVEPHMLEQAVVLDLCYRVPAPEGRLAGMSRLLPAPQLGGRVLIGAVRWRVELPAGSLPLYESGAYQREQPWRWAGLLAPPRAGLLAAEMEAWFAAGGERPAPANEQPAYSYQQLGGLAPLYIVHVPQQVWQLVCSLFVLIPGVVFACYPPRYPLVWLVVGVLGVILLGVLAPEVLLVAAYGAQLGLLVMAVVLVVLWLLHQRWRRQVVLLPGFARLKVGSSLQRSSVLRQQQRPPQPSTVDAPKAPGSSLKPEGQGEGGRT
jgi:hypothetical protein